MTREKRKLLRKQLPTMSDYQKGLEFMEMMVTNGLSDWYAMNRDHGITVEINDGRVQGINYVSTLFGVSGQICRLSQ